MLLLVVIALAWAIYLVATPLGAFKSMSTVDDSPAYERPAAMSGTAILLVGNDSRSDLSQDTQDLLHTGGDEGGSRADTIMILYRPPSGRSVLISLPRDSYVEIPDYGMDKLNTSYALGGSELLMATVEHATGLRLDGYLEIGFDSFANLVDTVGGVEVCLDEPMQDEYSAADFPAGCQTLDGPQALSYVRMRYADPRGDLGRAERQREVIAKVMKKMVTPSSIINPFTYRQMNYEVASLITRGTDTSAKTMLFSALGVLNISQGDGLSMQVPISDPAAWSPEGSSVVLWDDAQANELFSLIRTGDTSDLDRFVE